MTDFKNVVGMGNKSERLLLIDITAQQHGTNSSSSLSVHQPVNEASLQRKALVDTDHNCNSECGPLRVPFVTDQSSRYDTHTTTRP